MPTSCTSELHPATSCHDEPEHVLPVTVQIVDAADLMHAPCCGRANWMAIVFVHNKGAGCVFVTHLAVAADCSDSRSYTYSYCSTTAKLPGRVLH